MRSTQDSFISHSANPAGTVVVKYTQRGTIGALGSHEHACDAHIVRDQLRPR
jgi:hypothetical protein